jgi:insulysin
MIRLLFLATALTGSSSQEIEEIADLSELPLLNPDLADRKTQKLRLPNGLEVLLISDPEADQSSAVVTVEAGSWNDPQEYPGMAHFCEHMLFMGSHTYPNENEFSKMIADYNGQTNAFTASDRTVYMFASKTEGFLTILDRFSHFFIDPLFNPSGISRELHAVDQEYAKNLENDSWREHMIFKELSNPQHPHSGFNMGNSETLKGIPQAVLKKWHEKNYSANHMHVAIYSSMPLETLKEHVSSYFSLIPVTEEKKLDLNQKSITSLQQKGHIVYIKPIKNRNIFSLLWELPPELSDDDTKSAELLAYALGRGQKYGLYEHLKTEQWIDTMSIHVDDLGGKNHKFFQITLELTEKGVQNLQAATLRCFEALAGYLATGVPAYLYEEKNALAKLSYQYQSRQDAFQFAMKTGESLPDEPLSTYPRSQILASGYQAEKITQLISLLTPESCAFSLLAPLELSNVVPDRREKWLGAEYTLRSIPSDWMQLWTHAVPNPAIRLPRPNPFIPNKLSLVPAQEASSPVLIAENEFGIAYYCRAPEFQTPEVITQIHIRSPELGSDPRSSCLGSLYLDHLTDLLHPVLSSAQSAGLYTRFELDPLQLSIEISGFSEKSFLLLQEILKQMTLDPPTQEQFNIYVARHEKDYLNSQKELAVKQAKAQLDSLLVYGKSTKMQKLAALRTISCEQFLEFHKKLFEQTYIQAMFGGNLSLKEAESAWLDIHHILAKSPYPKAIQETKKVLSLPESGGPFVISNRVETQGNAAILLIDQGSFTFEARSAQEILANALHEAFFDTLRTKQKTGYIASSHAISIEKRLFQYFLVQSNSHQPEDLLYRFELFLETFNEEIASNITPDRFETLRQCMVHSLKTRFRNLKDKMNLWDMLAFEQDANFQFINERIKALEELEYDRFIALGKAFLERSNRKRLAVLCEGKLKNPFTYELVAPDQISSIARYTAGN